MTLEDQDMLGPTISTDPITAYEREKPDESREIEVGKLKIRQQYQRGLDEDRVKRMADHYDDSLAGTIEVSFADGHYWVVDGQHRLAAMRQRGIRTCRALIHYGLTVEDEARLFGQLNTLRRPITPRDLYRAELIEGSARTLGVESILRKYGLHVSLKAGHGPRQIAAVQYLWEMYAANTLDPVLGAIVAAWSDGEGTPTAGATEGRILIALSRFISINRGNPKFDLKRLHAVLSRHRPDELIREAKTYSTWAIGTRQTLFRWYNYNLQHKLPEPK